MNKKIMSIITTLLFAVVLISVSAVCLLKPATAYSEGERRELAKSPEFSLGALFGGEFMESFEAYATDQFPARESLRSLKAWFAYNIFGKSDNNGLFCAQGHLSELEYPQNDEMLRFAAEKFTFLYEKFIKDTEAKVYLSIVPDKNMFIAEKNGYLAMDYEKFASDFAAKVDFMQYIDIFPLLSADDYYTTDSHWRQEKIIHVAEHIAQKMGTSVSAEYEQISLNLPFKGVYAGQAAVPVKPDEIIYLTNDSLASSVVTYYNTGMPEQGNMYNMEKASGKDPYEVFLSGTAPLITIENPQASGEKELVIFRDSFGSSIAPLFAEGYKKITVVDIRYLQSDFVGNFVKFTNQDVLFLYSTTLLNNSTALR